MTERSDLPEARILPCPFCGPGNSMVSAYYCDSSKRFKVGCGRCGSHTGTTARKEDDSEQAAINRWNTRTPAIADGSDLFICRRSVAGEDRDGATRYYVYEPLRPYEAIADGVGVEPTQEELRLGRLIDRAIKAYYDDGDPDFMCNILEGKFPPPQAATDEGV